VAFNINLFANPGSHLAIFWHNASGKSIILGDIIFNAYLRDIPVVAFDPKETAVHPFTDLTNTMRELGGSAGYNNIADCHQFPADAGPAHSTQRNAEVKSFQVRGLMVLVMGNCPTRVDARTGL